MKYFNTTYYDSLKHSDTKRDLDGTSISKEKGTDGKANNTSAYNHDYYIHHKEKWQDNKDSKNGSSNGEDKSGLKDGDFDLDAAALDVIRGKYGNGQARKDAPGADYEMIQKRVNEMYKEGRFGNGSTSKTSTDNKTESTEASSERSTKWYENYNNRIADTKAQKAEKAAQEKAAKEAQEQAEKEAAAKAAKKKNK
jgi:hypothetical protein